MAGRTNPTRRDSNRAGPRPSREGERPDLRISGGSPKGCGVPLRETERVCLSCAGRARISAPALIFLISTAVRRSFVAAVCAAGATSSGALSHTDYNVGVVPRPAPMGLAQTSSPLLRSAPGWTGHPVPDAQASVWHRAFNTTISPHQLVLDHLRSRSFSAHCAFSTRRRAQRSWLCQNHSAPDAWGDIVPDVSTAPTQVRCRLPPRC